MRNIVYSAFFFFSAMLFGAESLEKLFESRSKCVVYVSYMLELEEDRQKISTCGLVADENGLIVISKGEIPVGIYAGCLKNFKVYFNGGDENGYPAEYIGFEPLSGFRFVKLKNGLSSGLVPFVKFPEAEMRIGEDIWGVSLWGEDVSYVPFLSKSSIECVFDKPFRAAVAQTYFTAVGGPVFNMDGDFIGIGTVPYNKHFTMRILTEKGGVANIGLSRDLQSSEIFSVADLKKALKRVPKDCFSFDYSWIGLAGVNIIDKKVSDFIGLKKGTSAFVIGDIIKDSPIDIAGLKKGDIITAVNSHPIEKLASDAQINNAFLNEIMQTSIGGDISFDIVREDKSIGRKIIKTSKSPKNIFQSKPEYFKRLGFSVREFLMDDSVERRILKNDQSGAVVSFVKSNGPAASASPSRLYVGDWIKEINSKPVKSISDAVKILTEISADTSVKELVILAEDSSETKLVKIKLD